MDVALQTRAEQLANEIADQAKTAAFRSIRCMWRWA